MTGTTYHTLCQRDPSTGLWSPQFGSDARSDVTYEKREFDRSVKRKDLTIITTGPSQAEIDAGVAALNINNQHRNGA